MPELEHHDKRRIFHTAIHLESVAGNEELHLGRHTITTHLALISPDTMSASTARAEVTAYWPVGREGGILDEFGSEN